MDIFPISLKLQQQRCLIVGGGHIALRKATLLAKAGAIIDVVAPAIEDQLLQLIKTTDGEPFIEAFAEKFLST
ncbi:NAD(P)-dependent oxidoreductase, partial [Acinetobacter baumannii]